MKFALLGVKIKRFVLKLCRRWSILASFLLYIVLFTLAKYLDIPLKSDDDLRSRDQQARGENNIIEYLHRLHNLKSNQVLDDYEKDKVQPFYALEETFHKYRRVWYKRSGKADYNHDNYLSADELSKWIHAKTQEHIHEAIVDNYKVFLTIDVKPKNGLISWEEYHSYFLHKNGYNRSYIQGHSEKHRDLNRSMKEAIMRDKAAWSECAKLDPDHLTLDEFLSFRHPESSFSTIISLVEEIYRKFDRDGDDILTEDEFSTLQAEDGFDKSESVRQEEKERRKEFREMVDLNNDGKATRKEMMTYIDPKNPRHAKEEAETLFALADVDRDGRLSLVEIFNKMDLFLGSKMVDTARSFHDEF